MGLYVPQDYSYSSPGFICATRSDHNIHLKSLSSPYHRFFDSTEFHHGLLKVSKVCKAFQKPPDIRCVDRLSEDAYGAVLSSLWQVSATRFDLSLACRKPLGTL